MKSRRRSYLVELDISLWVIEREKLVVEVDSDSDIQSTKAMEVCERVNFPIFEFLREFSERKWKMTTVWERERKCVFIPLYLSFFFQWEYTSLSISRDENILDIYFKGWVRVAWKNIYMYIYIYLKPAHAVRESKNCPLLFKILVVWSSLFQGFF